jgi:hypothetical protein
MWLNEDPVIPQIVQECISTQKIKGYMHHLITLNMVKDFPNRYVQECIGAKQWVKASDWLRMYYIFTHGGIFLDGDMEVLAGKNFDHLLNCRMFLAKEVAGLWANSALGCEPKHPVIGEYLRHVEANYRGDGELVFQPGIRAFDDVMWKVDLQKNGIMVCPTECFFPYNHLTGKTNRTPDTIVNHLYMKSWLPK